MRFIMAMLRSSSLDKSTLPFLTSSIFFSHTLTSSFIKSPCCHLDYGAKYQQKRNSKHSSLKRKGFPVPKQSYPAAEPRRQRHKQAACNASSQKRVDYISPVQQ